MAPETSGAAAAEFPVLPVGLTGAADRTAAPAADRTAAPAETPLDPAVLSAPEKRRLERRGKLLTGACVFVVMGAVAALIVSVAWQGLAAFLANGVDPVAFLTGAVWAPHASEAAYGAAPMILGSLAVTALSCAFALPVSVACAVYAVEVSPSFGSRVFRPVMELLAGVPSVVFGLLGLTVVIPLVADATGTTGYGILAGAVVLAFMVFPTITSLTMDTLKAVPQSYREAALGLGLTRWQAICGAVLPAALPGILTALVMGMARAFGESLAVQMVVGNAAAVPSGLVGPAATLTSVLTMGMANEAPGTPAAHALWALALVLLVMSLVFVGIVHWIGKRAEDRHGTA